MHLAARLLLTPLAALSVGGASSRGDDLPPQIKVLTDTLRKLNEPALADQLEQDLKAGRVTLGDTGETRAVSGVGAMDRSVILRPLAGLTGLGTGTTDTTMTISTKILTDIRAEPRALGSPANMNNVVGWALTLRHEYVHMGQKDPHPWPEFENPAYRETVKTGVSWYNGCRRELEEALAAPPTPEGLEKVNGILVRMNAVGQQVNDTFNDMPDRFKDGSLRPDEWTTLDGIRTRDIEDVQRQNWRTLARDKATFGPRIAAYAAAAKGAPTAGTASGIQNTRCFLVRGSWDLGKGSGGQGINLLSDPKGELKWQGQSFTFTHTTLPEPKSQTKVTREVVFSGRLSPDGTRLETFDLKVKTTYVDGRDTYLVQEESLAMKDLPRTWHPAMRKPFGDTVDEFRFSIERPEEAMPRLTGFLFKQVLHGRATESKAPAKFNRGSSGPPIVVGFGKETVN